MFEITLEEHQKCGVALREVQEFLDSKATTREEKAICDRLLVVRSRMDDILCRNYDEKQVPNNELNKYYMGTLRR